MHVRRALWLGRFGLALRTVLACAVVSCATMYGPEKIKKLIAFPAFSYLTMIVILSSGDSSLGETLRGCCNVLYATLQVMFLSLLSLWAIKPVRLTNGSAAAAAVALSAFMVALPESTGLLAKRIAFGQIVIVYVGIVDHGGQTGVVMHPVHVVASTALGASASLLAMLVPYPRLAYKEMRKKCRLYVEITSVRLNLFTKTMTAPDNLVASSLISQAKSVSLDGQKLLQSIKSTHEGVMWERPNIGSSRHKCLDPEERLQDIEFIARGMQLALDSCRSFPLDIIDEELKHALLSSGTQLGLKLEQANCSVPLDAMKGPEIKEKCIEKPLWNLKVGSLSEKDASVGFFWYCMEHFRADLPMTQTGKPIDKANSREQADSDNQETFTVQRVWDTTLTWFTGERLVFALKCSISLGLAVLFGLKYDKENAYWSGLTIAISFETKRQATFTGANARAQGTAMGSVYGILCCFIFKRLEEFRLLPLFPWIIFTTFLRHSRLYGQAGGISAVIGALLILGRKNYGIPSEFAIARITEASIGLLCFIFVEILLSPARAATLAKTELSQCLDAMLDCIQCMVLCPEQKGMPASTLTELRKNERKLKTHISNLEKYKDEARREPSFWFKPFNGACYNKLLESLSKISDLCVFVSYEIEFLSRAPQTLSSTWEDLQEYMTDDLKLFKKNQDSSIGCLKEFISTNSPAVLENELRRRKIGHDIEAGKPANWLGLSEEDAEKFLSSFLHQLKGAANKINNSTCEESLKSYMVICLIGLGFSISKLMREAVEIETELKELIKWENPTRQTNL